MNYERLQSDKKDILIIDDTPDNLRILSWFLTKKGYSVRKALNWQMALTACQTLPPDLILLDIMMPEVDGYEICRRLKACQQTADIPVIFISALDDVFDKVKAFQIGGVDYITKPFEFEEVLVRIENQLALRTAQLEILKLNAELENRVQERTWELKKTLHKLQQEMSQRQQLQNKLLEIVLHDSLTGLPNRVLLLKRLEEALNRAKRESNYRFAVLFLDCDRFKIVNDSLGHLVGDELLIAITSRLQESLSPFDTLARFGGDEFAILLENITDINIAIEVAESILEKLSLAFQLSRYEVFINASIGINWGNHNYEKPEYVLRDADTAMYRAKALGKGRYHVFYPAMHQEVIQVLELENDLRRAVERQEFVVHYQPIICLNTDKIAGFEALIRWQHPTKGLVYPTAFIPVAEEIGLINVINFWVLESACQTLQILQNHPHIKNNFNISVNLSPCLFSLTKFIAYVDQIIDKTKINPANLELEITENLLMDKSDNIKKTLDALKERKIKLVMDDFGTGYSSLSYLHNFPLNALKIDKSFVQFMQENQQNFGLVPAMISIAHSMEMKVTAEGIETEYQLSQLKKLKCDFAQGHFFSTALDLESVLNLIAAAPQW
ncbi:GGDEF domain-containing response regulator [Fischerella thermalis CCMEE 5268]|uniref:GGDEF domain-containing response regulator n=1 Tax=Fischerella thermalis CCMEE 5268 TaxID=2019662 RepID=A0A2N6KDR0_9CYAN|nr:EAL domain-containing response regulator [Fischerella thermalis]PLZ97015.1 GGDEF domain-containing response regulator [Fischerella thermalis CCMEE 5268]